jgi:hypothetical protein
MLDDEQFFFFITRIIYKLYVDVYNSFYNPQLQVRCPAAAEGESNGL